MTTLKDILVMLLAISAIMMYATGHWIAGTVFIIMMFIEARYKA
jgi:hypothetical protein